MLSPIESKANNKEKIQILLNKGLFDSHITEIAKALSNKRIFSKELRCFLREKNFPYLLKSLTPRNKDINKNKKKFMNNINSYDLNKHDETEFKINMFNLITSLNKFNSEAFSKFKELKKHNDSFINSFDAFKELNKKSDSIKEKKMINELSINYQFKKNISLDQQAILNSDFLKESPLSTTKYDKLHFYYIINRNNEKNKNKKFLKLKKCNELKEPIIWDEEKMNNLKEIKFLKKINRITKNKMRKVNFINKNDSDFYENDNLNYKSFNYGLKHENLIKSREDNKKIKLEIQNDKIEIKKLKNAINANFKENIKNKRFSRLYPW